MLHDKWKSNEWVAGMNKLFHTDTSSKKHQPEIHEKMWVQKVEKKWDHLDHGQLFLTFIKTRAKKVKLILKQSLFTLRILSFNKDCLLRQPKFK